MADIFISYSKADRELAIKLAAFLEAEGWTVWWDKSLQSADTFRDVIMRELMAARAVISIWTPNSIKSDWVRAEAGRAKAEGTLIPVKSSDVSYGDIPLPFGEMHTENVTATEQIRAAVVAQLSKPKVEPSTFWMATRTLRLQLLTWAGIVGGAITLFTNFRGLISLADWARWIVIHWQEWTHYLWSVGFEWIGVRLPHGLSPMLSLLMFVTLLVIGTALRSKHRLTKRNVGHFLVHGLGYLVWFFGFVYVLYWFSLLQFFVQLENPHVRLWAVVFVINVIPFCAIVLWPNDRLQRFLMFLFVFAFWLIMVFIPGAAGQLSAVSDSPVLFFTVWLVPGFAMFVVLSFAPLTAVNKRLLFVAMGTLLLLALNKISVLGVQHFLEAPKV
jgi:hypothetical protein